MNILNSKIFHEQFYFLKKKISSWFCWWTIQRQLKTRRKKASRGRARHSLRVGPGAWSAKYAATFALCQQILLKKKSQQIRQKANNASTVAFCQQITQMICTRSFLTYRTLVYMARYRGFVVQWKRGPKFTPRNRFSPHFIYKITTE